MTGVTTDELKQLFAEFPEGDISWRAQNVSKDGTKAMALAYIDARNVMDRLDQICGAENWQDRYEFHGPRTVCYLSIRVGDEWITKADGAGDTDVEGEKGAISDALKRAAVKWGVGRYLYEMPAPWVPCESYETNGKKRWSSWMANPWDYVRKSRGKMTSVAPSAALKRDGEWERVIADLSADLLDVRSTVGLASLRASYRERAKTANWPAAWLAALKDKFDEAEASLAQEAA